LCLRLENDEKRYEPTKSFTSLIELDLNADIVHDEDFQVLAVRPQAQLDAFVPHTSRMEFVRSLLRVDHQLL
jgi:hypothetical protein